MNTKVKNITKWTIIALLTVAFLGAGITKLTGQDMHVENFTRWGFPITFMYLVGILEILGVAGLYIRKLQAWGATGLALLMAGATGTHLIHNEPEMITTTLILLVLSSTLAALSGVRDRIKNARMALFPDPETQQS